MGRVHFCGGDGGGRSVTERQVDLLAVEEVVGVLAHSPPRHLLARECDQGLATALAAEIVQDENGVWLELCRVPKDRAILWAESDSWPVRSSEPRRCTHQGRTTDSI